MTPLFQGSVGGSLPSRPGNSLGTGALSCRGDGWWWVATQVPNLRKLGANLPQIGSFPQLVGGFNPSEKY